jgi:hypothetical protein
MLGNYGPNPLMDFTEDDFRKLSHTEGAVLNKGVRIVCMIKGEYARNWFVIVEIYDNKQHGRGKREYFKTFSKEERKVISHYYRLLYNWYLRIGLPEEFEILMKNFYLMGRAANFFATI